ncbi:MAG: cob(I)yrinic acid a,c-diamide adenosyltransferase [Proteobacteria bacterium]|nr:cob(I)yrinic acid a,c-diamide adenosyltransferase [Pseudomonadota bacterium]MBU1581471.1 cob(I)yrinic acid a,c-diamide adenosyltransferase [Pseudomonadota bacterium]MBU2453528.1 cob(I)yrinic acid a,c-diamide adenosyltransferase [Pseudomonadota bacterium]MBU2630704.1 cob(I)yrinic acid a,c-diamide adenosyltransferase [Pseudomonadota bacterium]
MKGYVQVYTGNGKGKTTASLGLAIRAAGAGLSVYIVQFLKKGDYSEIKALSKFKNITVEQYGLGKFIKGKPSDEDIAAGAAGYLKLCEILKNNKHDVVIAEEGNVAVMCNLISEKELLALIENKPANVELVITGRGATEAVMEKADLVTEMREIKHYYKQGVKARIGIEK